MPYPLICDGMEQVQIKNKKNKKEEIKGEIVVLNSHGSGPKARSGLTPRPDGGRPTLLWLVGPHRAALYKGEGDSTA